MSRLPGWVIRLNPALNIAVRAARAAGESLLRGMDYAADRREVREKAPNDFVSRMDEDAERRIIDTLHKAFPSHAVLSEESGLCGGRDAECQWIIDPLDGTTNYLHGLPQFAVSIALRRRGRLELGVILDPMREELFVCSRGEGAFCNDRRIRVSRQTHLHGAVLGTGFPFGQRVDTALQPCLRALGVCMPQVAGIRRFGAAALDLAWLACGRLDGFWEYGLKLWDIAAGVLLLQEAGAMVTDMQGGERHLDSGDVLAANPLLHKRLLALLNENGAGTA